MKNNIIIMSLFLFVISCKKVDLPTKPNDDISIVLFSEIKQDSTILRTTDSLYVGHDVVVNLAANQDEEDGLIPLDSFLFEIELSNSLGPITSISSETNSDGKTSEYIEFDEFVKKIGNYTINIRQNNNINYNSIDDTTNYSNEYMLTYLYNGGARISLFDIETFGAQNAMINYEFDDGGAFVENINICLKNNHESESNVKSNQICNSVELDENFSYEFNGLTEDTEYEASATMYIEVNDSEKDSVLSSIKTFQTRDGIIDFGDIDISDITANTVNIRTEIDNDGGSEITEKGICYSVINEDNNDISSSDLGPTCKVDTGPGSSISMTLNDLSAATTYNVYAYAKNGIIVDEDEKQLSEPKEIKTRDGIIDFGDIEISGITAKTVNIRTEIDNDGGSEITEKGVCVDDKPIEDEITDICTNDGVGDSNFDSSREDLAPGTTYYTKAYAVNSVNTWFSDEEEFITEDGVINFGSVEVEDIAATTAKLTVELSYAGNTEIDEKGYCFSTSEIEEGKNPTENGCIEIDSTDEKFSVNLEDLEPATGYYFEAYAINEVKTHYSNSDVYKITRDGIIDFGDIEISGITANSVNIRIEIDNDGGSEITEKGICYSVINEDNNDISSSDLEPTCKDDTGSGSSISLTLNDLSAATTYNVYAYAINGIIVNGNEEQYSDPKDFTTMNEEEEEDGSKR